MVNKNIRFSGTIFKCREINVLACIVIRTNRRVLGEKNGCLSEKDLCVNAYCSFFWTSVGRHAIGEPSSFLFLLSIKICTCYLDGMHVIPSILNIKVLTKAQWMANDFFQPIDDQFQRILCLGEEFLSSVKWNDSAEETHFVIW